MEVEKVDVMEMLPPKPWQRLAANMFASGIPFHEIAPQVNQPVQAISGFVTSQQGQMLINQAIKNNVEMLNRMLEAAAVDTLLVLIRIRDTSDKDTTRIAAAKTLLDKIVPSVRPKDRKIGTVKTIDDPQQEIAKLREFLNQA